MEQLRLRKEVADRDEAVKDAQSQTVTFNKKLQNILNCGVVGNISLT